ncbi:MULTISPECIES: hypothetical protein [Pontibacter]|uniref:Uncharacterized protein n=1 Tax=Pontibacter lucknowensis TaxID=1077936 RepID=A0A1N6XJC5_9BACT|nr:MULTISPECIES: hypothetical protein [Pontibacter]EJF11490.1 hypothetical protein O71_02902 [Pontibacter sp. BAB1700]SIR02341.1 hypothetical protein SAMN05421545_2171 [Pontibacter lucknowensis]
MDELVEFLSKLDTCECDLVVLTFISDDRLYCRFFQGGVYKDRMFVNDPDIIVKLRAVCGEGEEIDTVGISKLRKVLSTQGSEPA